jgi:hypothetical protein
MWIAYKGSDPHFLGNRIFHGCIERTHAHKKVENLGDVDHFLDP